MMEMGIEREMTRVLRILRKKKSSTMTCQSAAVEHRTGHVGNGALDQVALVDYRGRR